MEDIIYKRYRDCSGVTVQIMFRNEIGCYNRWGRFAFRHRSYRVMMHCISEYKHDEIALGKPWNYHSFKKFYEMLQRVYG